MQHTLVAVFDDRTDAQNAMNELLSSGFSKADVRLSNADPTGQTDSSTGESDIAGDRDLAHDRAGDTSTLGIAASIKHFFSDLFGSDNPDHASRYEGAVTRGHHVLTLTADSLPEVERAADIVERYGPTDIDEQASEFGEVPSGMGAMRMGSGSGMQSSPMSSQSASSPTLENAGDRKILQQQSLNQAEPMGTTYQEPMGKSGLTATGGTSLQGSTLQENSVQGSSLEGTQQTGVGIESSGQQGGTLRGPTQRSGALQSGALQGSSLEGSIQSSQIEPSLREDYQQAGSLSGGARTGSQQLDATSSTASAGRRETQRGGVRIYSRGAETPAGRPLGSAGVDDDAYYRSHFTSNFGSSGASYDDYAPAYRYGSQMRSDSRYANRQWDDVEGDLRTDWETRNAGSTGSTWEKMKAAVRHGWDKMTRDDDGDYYRSHFTSNYAGTGKTYDDYAPAYSYGTEMARSETFRNRPWDEAMPSLRSDWESRNTGSAGSTWENMKDAVRRGWERMTDDDEDNYYRSHYSSTYGSSGESYDTYRPAYQYGSSMRRDPQYSNRAWDDSLETELRSGWQSRYPGGPSTWDKVKEAVRHGWNRLTY